MNSQKPYTAIVGLGKTGLSFARYLRRKNKEHFFVMMDAHPSPKALPAFQAMFPDVPVYLGDFAQPSQADIIHHAQTLLLSPGITAEQLPAEKVLSDIELFSREAKAPIIGITGTNAKSTVTTLLGKMIEQAGLKVLIGGNIGTPALDLLEQPIPDFYVLEISSFQLEILSYLPLKTGVILNMTPDHLDRHKDMDTYYKIKQKIYANCDNIVFNREDNFTFPVSNNNTKHFSFGLSAPLHNNEFGIVNNHLFFREALMPVNQLKIAGKHHWLNALAALALGQTLDLPLSDSLIALKKFSGLPHRCEWVSHHRQVHWYNDSKGTNIGATIASLTGLGDNISSTDKRKIILILGGIGKEQDFSVLQTALQKYVKNIILIGQDANLIKKAISSQEEKHIILAETLQKAVSLAEALSKPEDIVLFSPACASFDMFIDFEDRGNQFKQLVHGLCLTQ